MRYKQTPKLKARSLATVLGAIASFGCYAQAQAQTAPDAGQTLRELQKPDALPLPKDSAPLIIQPPPAAITPPGGPQVMVKEVTFVGNTVLSSEALMQALGPLLGKSFDLAGLRDIANQVTEIYRANGYPFARAFLPPQPLDDGTLRIEIVEGRYGKVSATSEDVSVAQQAQAWLGGLKPGAVIESEGLERATLLLDDLPGVRTAPVIRPGAEVGTGDLAVGVSKEQPYDISVGIENHGNRYTGYNRARVSANFNSPFMLGDQVSLTALGSDKDLWLGSANYSLPLGNTGLRGSLGVAHTTYELAREFANSGEGTADVGTLGLSYPLIRSQKTNITLAGTWQYKRLKDDKSNPADNEKKHSNTLPLSVQFDHRDALGGGGVTYGSVTWTLGEVNVTGGETASDPQGKFNKLNLDIARMQALPENFMLYGRVSAQAANKNLDSSEDMSLAGPGGVRAYPVGELSGDEGWLGQIELRYVFGAYAPYVFYDHGRIRSNQDGSGTSRTLAGGGVGLRYQRGGWSADLALAWRSEGGRPADAKESDGEPRAWVSVGYRF
ncbi:ShlB/FhaC/HecB family hemolysin secretion/activation protein [beta proteobacterium MWH-UniP1]